MLMLAEDKQSGMNYYNLNFKSQALSKPQNLSSHAFFPLVHKCHSLAGAHAVTDTDSRLTYRRRCYGFDQL